MTIQNSIKCLGCGDEISHRERCGLRVSNKEPYAKNRWQVIGWYCDQETCRAKAHKKADDQKWKYH